MKLMAFITSTITKIVMMSDMNGEPMISRPGIGMLAI